ncbi:hypothetical protein LINPERPRIM_LOCUS8162 [Linum perenne]
MACNRGSTEPRVGSLRNPPSRATHNAVQEATELPTAAGGCSSSPAANHGGLKTSFSSPLRKSKYGLVSV